MPKLKVSLNPFELPRMSREANEVARESGMRNHNDVDSFRHAYTSAKIAEKNGYAISAISGGVVEIVDPNNTKNSAYIDLRNNAYGLKILSEVEEHVSKEKEDKKLSDDQVAELQDQMLRNRIADAVNSGELSQHSLDKIEEDEKKKPQNTGDKLLSHPYDRR